MFTRNGKPFFPLGGQAHNSSAYNEDELASAIAGLLALRGNTLEAPVYWEQLEPTEGVYDFTAVDTLVATCRAHDLALVVLWFGTWKNGEMRYVPEWVKRDPARFPRVTGPDGAAMQVLSSYGKHTRDADEKAFVALCRRLAAQDPGRDTLIAVQVENEPGILGSDRDYGAAAAAAAAEPVDPAVLSFLERRGHGTAYEAWKERGLPKGKSWSDTFGLRGYELREAYAIARYVDSIAEAGQRVLDVPMYANAWLSQDGWAVPGFYPAGGPVWRTLDIWKAVTPHLAVVAPDIYVANTTSYREVCGQYGRDDNPLFIPESGADDANAANLLIAVSEFAARGVCCFGSDSVADLEGNLRPSARLFAQSLSVVRSLLPLLERYRGTGQVRAVYPQPARAFQAFEFGRYLGMVPFVPIGLFKEAKDHRHVRGPESPPESPVLGLIVEAGPDEFYLAGHFHLHLVRASSPQWLTAIKFPVVATPPDYLSVEEGDLSPQGQFLSKRRRNGDEVVFGGFWCSPGSGVVRVRLNPGS